MQVLARDASTSCEAVGDLGWRLGLARLRRQPAAGHHPVVVESQQPDHVANVGLILDSARGRARLIGEDGVVHHPTLLDEVGPDLLREGEVSRVVAVQVTDLLAADFEGELAAAAGPCLHSRPGGDFLGDLLACCWWLRDGGPQRSDTWPKSSCTVTALEVEFYAVDDTTGDYEGIADRTA